MSNPAIIDSEWKFSQRSQQAGGQPIGDLMSRALGNPNLISLAAGFVDPQTLPVELVRSATEAVLNNPDTAVKALQYTSAHGSSHLRQLLLERLLEMDCLALGSCSETQRDAAQPSDVALDQVVLTAGSNQLLHLICDALIDEGDIILCAAPTYLVFLGIMQNVGGRCWGVGSDDQGICPAALDQSLAELEAAGELDRVKGIYLVSYSDNPAGRTMGQDRRQQLNDVVSRWNTQLNQPMTLIEDAAYRQLRFEGEDIPSFLSHDPHAEHTVYLGTFSKSLSPGLRVGWGVLPVALAAAVIDLKTNLDFGSPHFSQQLVATVLEQRVDEPHIGRLCDEYRKKRDVMLAALDLHVGPIEGVHWRVPNGGLYIWLELPDDMQTGPDSPLWDEALREGMIYVPGEFCQPDNGVPKARNGMRLSFGVPAAEQIRTGIEMLSRAIRVVQNRN